MGDGAGAPSGSVSPVKDQGDVPDATVTQPEEKQYILHVVLYINAIPRTWAINEME